MGYIFKGVFITPCHLSTVEAEKLFRGYAREISEPFQGIVLSFANQGASEEEQIQQKVLKCSQNIKGSKIAYLNYSTWAGPVDHCYGFVCQNGELIAGSEMEAEDEAGREVLIKMLEILGVENPSSNFPPFERGYFPNT